MTEPLRKEKEVWRDKDADSPKVDTTSSLAAGVPTEPASNPTRPRLVQSGYPSADRADGAATQAATPAENAARSPDDAPLFQPSELTDLRSRWDQIQTRFVDEPRKAVSDADALVTAATNSLAQAFAAERSMLEQQWDRGDSVSTEDLRVALQRYRSFFNRVLSI